VYVVLTHVGVQEMAQFAHRERPHFGDVAVVRQEGRQAGQKAARQRLLLYLI
jgi:hypothetical protein